jgi:hypothetical protein
MGFILTAGAEVKVEINEASTDEVCPTRPSTWKHVSIRFSSSSTILVLLPACFECSSILQVDFAKITIPEALTLLNVSPFAFVVSKSEVTLIPNFHV